jgi:ferric-dicitrate binding protein FerR (iron transport regulator)
MNRWLKAGLFCGGAAWTLAAPVLAEPAKKGLEMGAIVTSVEGEVAASTAPGAAWRPVERGWRLGPTSSIKTGPGSSAELMVEDQTALRVDPDTTLTIEKASRKGYVRELKLKLARGRLLSSVVKANKFGKARYSVQTPLAVASIRGTVFVADAAEESSRLAVFEGTVQAQSLERPEEEVEVGEKMEMDVKPGVVMKPHPLSEDMEAYRQGMAALFETRIRAYREDMDQVRRLYEDLMNRRQTEMQDLMEERRLEYQRLMEERRPKGGDRP